MTFNPGDASGALAGASDVTFNNPQDQQLIGYNATSAKWQNQSLEALGMGPTNGGAFARAYHKRVIHSLPFKHTDYASAQAQWGDFYPQAFAVDTKADELFIISSNSASTMQIVSIYKWSTGQYKQVFGYNTVYVTEGAVILYEGSQRFLYVRYTSNGLGKIDITQLPGNLAKVTTITTINTNQGINFSYWNGIWTVSDRTYPIGVAESRGQFKRLDANFTTIGQFRFPESLAGGNTYKYRDNSIPKMQGFADAGGYFAVSIGGYYAKGATVTPYSYNGLRLLSGQGEVLVDALLDPARMIQILETSGLHPSRVENEGVQLVSGAFCSLIVTSSYSGPNNTTEGLLILEEFSTAPDAIDFRSAATVWTAPDVVTLQSGLQPRSNDNRMYSPFTGELLDTLGKIMDYMIAVNQSEFSFYSSSVTVTDTKGVAFPSGNVVHIYSGNNSTFFVQLIGTDATWYKIYPDTANSGQFIQNVFTPKAGSGLYPATDGTVALGSATAQWSEVYAKNGVIISSPNGTKYRLTVGDDGAVSTTLAP